MWFFKKKNTKPKRLFKGVDLEVYQYLGYSIPRMVDHDGETTSRIFLYYFCDKEDHSKRKVVREPLWKYKHVEDHFIKHDFCVNSYVWEIGEKEIYTYIHGEPSDFLKDYMHNKFACEWSEETRWWVSTQNAKYESAQKKQKNNITEDKIIKVDFGKGEREINES